MQFNSESNSDDLVSDITFWTGADLTAYPLIDRSRNSNRGLDRVTALILKCDKGWRHDDTVQTSELLDVSSNLVSGTQKYITSVTWLKIAQIRVKDSAGDFITLSQKDRNKMSDSELTATSGTPSTYFRMGNYIYLNPKPSYASTGGLEVQFQRGASYFIPTDTTKTPGFASHFHRLVSLYASLDYCEINELDKRAAKIQKKIDMLEAELIVHYSERNEDIQPRISVRDEDYGQSALGGGSSSNPFGL